LNAELRWLRQGDANQHKKEKMNCPVCKLGGGKSAELKFSSGVKDAYICADGHLFITFEKESGMVLTFRNPDANYSGPTDFEPPEL
jgi:hypothetical protein